MPETDRHIYAVALARPGCVQAGFEWFRSFEQDAADFAQLSQKKADAADAGARWKKIDGGFLLGQAQLVATDVCGIQIESSGHGLMAEAPDQTLPALAQFIDGSS